MIVLIQRVAEASVSVGGRVIGAVGRGLLALEYGEPGDTPAVIGKLARKTARLRIFEDEAGRMADRRGAALSLLVAGRSVARWWRGVAMTSPRSGRGARPSLPLGDVASG